MVDISENEIMRGWENYHDIQVSIKCTAYNHEKYIEQALDSFLLQNTNFPFEIIIHDDKSTDKTLTIIERYLVKFPHIIRVIVEKENLYSQNKKNLINHKMDKIAKGKYIALCEGDDYWIDKNKLQMQFEALENHPECSSAFSKTCYVDVHGVDIRDTIPPRDVDISGVFDLDDFVREQFGNCKWVLHTSGFFYRSKYANEMRRERDRQFKDFPYGDITIVLFLLLKGKGFLINRVQTCYRYLSGGYNSSVRADVKRNIHDIRKLCDGLNNFDEQTKFIYHKHIQHRVVRAQFDIDRLNKATIALFRNAYWVQIPMREHIGAIIESLNPKLYKILKGNKGA